MTDYRLTHNATQELMTPVAGDLWFELAMEYLKQTHDANGWRVMLYGA